MQSFCEQLDASVGAFEGKTETHPSDIAPCPSVAPLQTTAASQCRIACTMWHFSQRGRGRKTSRPLTKRHELGFNLRWRVFSHSARAQKQRRCLVFYHILYSSCTMDNECVPVGRGREGFFAGVGWGGGVLSSAAPVGLLHRRPHSRRGSGWTAEETETGVETRFPPRTFLFTFLSPPLFVFRSRSSHPHSSLPLRTSEFFSRPAASPLCFYLLFFFFS